MAWLSFEGAEADRTSHSKQGIAAVDAFCRHQGLDEYSGFVKQLCGVSIRDGLTWSVCRLVDSFLDFLARCLPLADAKEKRTPSKPQARPEPGEAAKLAAQARAEGGQSGPSSPAQELRNVLASTNDLSVLTLAVPLYGAMLRALPVSVRSWFQGLTDKRQSSALEVPTSEAESHWHLSPTEKHHQGLS